MSISRNGGLLTCSVDNVRPQAHLEWIYTGDQEVPAPIKLTQRNTSNHQTGDLYSSTLTARYDVTTEVAGNISMMCRVTDDAFENRLKGVTIHLVDSSSSEVEDRSHLVLRTILLATAFIGFCGLCGALSRKRKHKPWRRQTRETDTKKKSTHHRPEPSNEHTVDGSPLIVKMILGLEQPMDVVTMDDSIVVVMRDYVNQFDWYGTSRCKYAKPGIELFAAATDSEHMYITDQLKWRVIKLNRQLEEVDSLGLGRLGIPTGIAISGIDGWIMVANKTTPMGSAVVSIFNKEGAYMTEAAYNVMGSPWRMLCYADQNRLYVADNDAMQVNIFNIDNQFKFIKTFNTELNSKRMRCLGLTLDDNGNIYATLRAPGFRSQMECVAKYDREGTQIDTYWPSPPPNPRLKALFSKLWGGKSIDSVVDDIFFTDKRGTLLDFPRGIHYCKNDEKEYLLIVDAGNKCLRVNSLVDR